MQVLEFIEEAVVIRKILDHLGLWDDPKRLPKRGREPPVMQLKRRYSCTLTVRLPLISRHIHRIRVEPPQHRVYF